MAHRIGGLHRRLFANTGDKWAKPLSYVTAKPSRGYDVYERIEQCALYHRNEASVSQGGAFNVYVALLMESPLDGAAKFVEAAGKGTLSFIAFLVLVLAYLAYKFFGKDSVMVRGSAFLVMIACIFSLIFILGVSPPRTNASNDGKQPKTDPPHTQDSTTPSVKQCTGSKEVVFTPQMPGVMQTGPDGRRISLGDGGGGTTLEEWKYTWRAPAKVTSVSCSTGRNEHVLAENKDGSLAECIGSINGGNDAMTMHVSWDGPCE